MTEYRSNTEIEPGWYSFRATVKRPSGDTQAMYSKSYYIINKADAKLNREEFIETLEKIKCSNIVITHMQADDVVTPWDTIY